MLVERETGGEMKKEKRKERRDAFGYVVMGGLRGEAQGVHGTAVLWFARARTGMGGLRREGATCRNFESLCQ